MNENINLNNQTKLHKFSISELTRPNRIIDIIASNNGYKRKNDLAITHSLTHSHTPNQSRDAIASKEECKI